MRKNELKSRNQGKTVTKEMTIEERIKQEEQVREKIDEKGNKWLKLYFGGGPISETGSINVRKYMLRRI